MALLGPLPQDQKKIKGTVLFTEDIVALLPSSHRLAERTSIKLTELRDDPFVLYPKGYVLHDVIMEGCLQRGFRPQVAFEGKDLDAIKGLVSAGLGVTMLPEVTLIDNLPRATARVPIVEPSLKRTVGIIVPKERELLPTEKEFFKFIRAFFKRIEHFQQ